MAYGDTWEYRVLRANQEHLVNAVNGAQSADSGKSLWEVMNVWGKEGWEAVGSMIVPGNYLEYLFKRPLPR